MPATHEHYDDGSAIEVRCEPDDPPSDGVWRDPWDAPLSEEELESGRLLGDVISHEDDGDNGLYLLGIDR
jgi:hypothetical protein